MVKLIAAVAQNSVIGKNNDLIWHLPADMKFFTQSTSGHVVIMGRKNWDSIPLKYRPLSNRINVVVTRNKTFSHPDCVVFYNLEDAVEHYKSAPEKEIFIIGGGQIYRDSLEKNLVDEMLISHIDASFDGDTFFPEFNPLEWEKQPILRHQKDEKNQYSFTVVKYSKIEKRKQ